MERPSHLGFLIDLLVDDGLLLLLGGDRRHVCEAGGLFSQVDDGKRVHVGLARHRLRMWFGMIKIRGSGDDELVGMGFSWLPGPILSAGE